MKANRLSWLLLFLTLGVTAAQQTNLFYLPGVTNGMTFKQIESKAETGDENAQWVLGASNAGRGTAEGNSESLKWFQKSAQQGNTKGQLFLGVAYNDGIGVTTIFILKQPSGFGRPLTKKMH